MERPALAAATLAGAPLAAIAAPIAQAQVEEETEGSEELDGPGEGGAGFEDAPEDEEPERDQTEEELVVPPPTSPAPPPQTKRQGPGGSAPGSRGERPSPALPSPPVSPTPPARPSPLLRSPLPPVPPPRPQALGDLSPALGEAPPAPGSAEPRVLRFHAAPRHIDDSVAAAPGAAPDPPQPRSTEAPSLQPAAPQPAGAAPDADSPRTERSANSAPARGKTVAIRGRSSQSSRATYRVRPGDSLWSIAEAQLGPRATDAQVARTVDRLWALNGERVGTGDPDLVMPGTVLRLR